MSGNTSEIGYVGGSPEESFLFLLTAAETLESDWLEIGLCGWESTLRLEVSGALPTARENPGERFVLTPGRTHNRIRSPR